jgi:2-amino-4-hydroxy-6-hydroxymethyldihydropteridine diphosphokinase
VLITAYIGLGANLGEARVAVTQAVAEVGKIQGVQLTKQSSLYRSAPVDSDGPDYVNAVVEVQTRLAAMELLRALQAVENQAGRARPYHNAPRTLDLDLLLYGEQQIVQIGLIVPHPRMWQRAFVLWPLAEIAPHCVAQQYLHDVRGQTISRLS